MANYDELQFQQNFRMNREAFENLLIIVSSKIPSNEGPGRPTIPAKKQLLAIIWLLATPESYRCVILCTLNYILVL